MVRGKEGWRDGEGEGGRRDGGMVRGKEGQRDGEGEGGTEGW